MKNLIVKIKRIQSNDQQLFAFSDVSGKTLFSVSCQGKKIKGKDLFDSIYAKAETGDPINVEVDQSELNPEDQKQFGNYVKDLFDSINEAMNKQFTTEGSDTATPTPNA